jgi:hypothetical protein
MHLLLVSSDYLKSALLWDIARRRLVLGYSHLGKHVGPIYEGKAIEKGNFCFFLSSPQQTEPIRVDGLPPYLLLHIL